MNHPWVSLLIGIGIGVLAEFAPDYEWVKPAGRALGIALITWGVMLGIVKTEWPPIAHPRAILWSALWRTLGYVDGRWTWRLRVPWESAGRHGAQIETQQPLEGRTPVSYVVAYTVAPSVSETLAAALFALDELIGKPVHSSADVHAQNQAFESVKAQIIAYVRESVSHTQAYDLAHPGLSIVTRDPAALSEDHNGLLHSMRVFRTSLQQMHIRELPLPSVRPDARPDVRRLFDLRKTGVEIRNTEIKSLDGFNIWRAQYERWRLDVLSAAGDVSVNLKSMLETLNETGGIPAGVPMFSVEHAHVLQIMSEILRRLDLYLSRYI